MNVETVDAVPETGEKIVKLNADGNETLWETHRHVTYGRCYTLKVPEEVVQRGVLEMVFYFHQK